MSQQCSAPSLYRHLRQGTTTYMLYEGHVLRTPDQSAKLDTPPVQCVMPEHPQRPKPSASLRPWSPPAQGNLPAHKKMHCGYERPAQGNLPANLPILLHTDTNHFISVSRISWCCVMLATTSPIFAKSCKEQRPTCMTNASVITQPERTLMSYQSLRCRIEATKPARSRDDGKPSWHNCSCKLAMPSKVRACGCGIPGS